MAKKTRNGMYLIGSVNEDKRSNRKGKYYVATGENINGDSHIEWKPVKYLKTSKWYAVRVGPTEIGSRYTNTVAHIIKETNTKNEAVEYLEKRVNFDNKF